MKTNPNDRGETLIELLVTVIIMGIAVVALVGGVAVSIRMSDIHRKQAAAGAYVRAYAEAIENAVAKSPTEYKPCVPGGPAPTYPSFAVDPPYTAEITAVKYWDGSVFSGTCTSDTGVQKVSLRVTAGTTVAETLDVIIRKPCRSTDDFPLDALCT